MYERLKNAIKAVIKENGNEEITGPILQDVLLAIIQELGLGFQFLGIATEETVPPTDADFQDAYKDSNLFYIAQKTGNYPHFNLSVGEREIGFFLYKDGAWVKEEVEETGTISAEELQEIIDVLND